MPTDMEGGNSISLCTRTQRPDESKNQGHVQLNQEAAGLLWQRSAYRRTTFLFAPGACGKQCGGHVHDAGHAALLDRKSTRLNSSHVSISYAVFCLNKTTYIALV